MNQFYTLACRWSVALRAGCGLAFALLATPAMAQTPTPHTTPPLDLAAVDAVVARTLKAFDVPGMAVAVV